MTSPIDIENRAPGPSGARLPALGSPEVSIAYLSKIKETLEVLLGRRGGSAWDRAVTFRDLVDMGLSGTAEAGGALAAAIGGQPAQILAPGAPSTESIESAIKNSAAYRRLMARIGSAEDLAGLPAEIVAQLETSISDLARQRQADIQTLQRKQQTAQMSFASQLQEVTAAVQQSAAGVRQFTSSYADDKRAIALAIQQLSAEIGDVGNINIEERLQALADSVMGLQGQYTIKIQANPVNGKPVLAGIDLAVTSPIEGPGTSSILFLAEEFAFVTSGGEAVPFSIAGQRIRFNGDVVINGKVVLGDGVPLDPSLAPAGTLNSELDIGVGRNMLVNSAPASATGYSFATSVPMSMDPAAVVFTQEGQPFFQYSPNKRHVYVHISGTPPTGSVVDLYNNAAALTPVLPKGRYEAGVCLSAHRCKAQVAIAWFDVNKQYIATSTGTEINNNGSTYTTVPFPRSTLFATAPDNAAFARTCATLVNTGGSDVFMFASEFFFGAALAGQTTPTAWTEGAPSDTRAIGYAGDLEATKGAPAGTMVGDALAELINAWARQGSSAAAALPGVNMAIEARLRKDAADTISGKIGLRSQYALLVGDENNGVWMGSDGIFLVQGGVVKASLPISGNPTFAGQLLAAFGSFGSITVAPGGSISSGQTAFHTGVGWWFGLDNGVPKFSIGYPGVASLRWDGTQLIAENLSAAMTPLPVSISTTGANLTTSYSRNASVATTVVGYVNVSGGSGSYTYSWSISADGYPCWLTNPGANNCAGAMKGPGIALPDGVGFVLSCIVTDTATGRTGQAYFYPTIIFS